MAASIGSGGFALWTGRAVSLRAGALAPARGDAPGAGARGGAAILIAGPGCWPSRERAAAAVARYGGQVVITAGLDDDVRNDLINARILVITLDSETVTKVADTVGADPGIALTVDAGRGEVRARGELLARFEIDGASGGTIAGRLLLAQRLLASASLSGDARKRWQRRLVAICDATKIPGGDPARGVRRLDRLLTELAAATGHAGLGPGTRCEPPGGSSRARRRA